MKTRNKTVFVLWQGIALVAILVSLLAVGFGASIAYAGAGGGAGGGSGAAGGGSGAAGGGGGTAGGNGGVSGSNATCYTPNCYTAEWDPTTVALMPVPAGSTNTFVLIVTNQSSLQDDIDLGKVTILVPPEFTYVDNTLGAVSQNYYERGHPWHDWALMAHTWDTDDSGAPLLVAQVPFHNGSPKGDWELEVNQHGCTTYRDYLVITFDATAPSWCYPTGGDQFQDYEFTTSAFDWGKTGQYQDPDYWVDGYRDCYGHWHPGYWHEGQWHDTYGWLEDNLCKDCAQPVVTVEAPACPEPTPTPEPEEIEVLTPTLPLLNAEEAPVSTPVLVVDILGTIVRYPVTQDGKLLADAMTTSPDGLVTLFMPAGTQVLNPDGSPAYLNKDPDLFSITAATPAAPASYTMVATYEFLPSGIIFSPDATLIIKYNAEKIPADGAPVIAYYDEAAGQWINLETAGYVAGGVEVPNTVQAHTAHLTYFAVLAK